ncbi:hypothetical protein ACF06D_13705 [Streptomyces griseoluteus]|uniref:hypothetical protein n=1 Tax=Streptomyces griseoluteus TaxID=29306 RepID=UPI0036F96DDF
MKGRTPRDNGILDIARGYGLEAHRAESLDDLSGYLRQGATATGPPLVDIHPELKPGRTRHTTDRMVPPSTRRVAPLT